MESRYFKSLPHYYSVLFLFTSVVFLSSPSSAGHWSSTLHLLRHIIALRFPVVASSSCHRRRRLDIGRLLFTSYVISLHSVFLSWRRLPPSHPLPTSLTRIQYFVTYIYLQLLSVFIVLSFFSPNCFTVYRIFNIYCYF